MRRIGGNYASQTDFHGASWSTYLHLYQRSAGCTYATGWVSKNWKRRYICDWGWDVWGRFSKGIWRTCICADKWGKCIPKMGCILSGVRHFMQCNLWRISKQLCRFWFGAHWNLFGAVYWRSLWDIWENKCGRRESSTRIRAECFHARWWIGKCEHCVDGVHWISGYANDDGLWDLLCSVCIVWPVWCGCISGSVQGRCLCGILTGGGRCSSSWRCGSANWCDSRDGRKLWRRKRA